MEQHQLDLFLSMTGINLMLIEDYTEIFCFASLNVKKVFYAYTSTTRRRATSIL